MTLFYLLIPLIMVVCGFFMYRFPPKKRNGFVGYITKRAGVNEDTWLFANRYCGKLWMKLGGILLLFALAASILLYKAQSETLSLIIEAVELTILLGSIIPVETALRRTFDENGKRR